MSKTEHTRWTFEAEETSSGTMFSVYDEDDWRVTDVSVREDQARLIAAAPEMLAALKAAKDTIHACDAGDPTTETGWASDDLLDVWKACDAAISRATGQAGEG